ncbi:unnamed protein product [Cyprideis torosa]|uniref:Uncharacterized protein n=1 Tax=Cyprideis torosa TaxID=163714 RepID=A0A7R8WR10_9CRUS|nr:unnamed protein product [Cyprideis torosa]CAG0902326.1 unnamed protein product [Cyprideis torosa]
MKWSRMITESIEERVAVFDDPIPGISDEDEESWKLVLRYSAITWPSGILEPQGKGAGFSSISFTYAE